jgi:hypothetical protein
MLCVVASIWLGAATEAWAKKRVVLLKFEGLGSDSMQDAVADVLQRENTIVSDSAFRRSQKRLGVRKLSEIGYARVAADVQADAIVTGTLARAGRRWRLALVVREGRSGEMTATLVVQLRSAVPDEAAKNEIAAQVLPVIQNTVPIGGEDVDEGSDPGQPPRGRKQVPVATAPPPSPSAAAAPPPPPAPAPSAAQSSPLAPGTASTLPPLPAPPAPQPAPPAARPPELALRSGTTDPVAAAAAAPRPAPPGDAQVARRARDAGAPAGGDLINDRRARHAPIDLALESEVSLRTMSFAFSDALTMAQRPNGYAGTPVPSLGLQGEVYPFSFGDAPNAAAAGLGFAFHFDRVFLLKSKLGTTFYDTAQTRYGGGLRYRVNFGSRARLPTLTFIAGYSHLEFAIQHGSDNIDLPNVAYDYLELGLRLRVPFASWGSIFLDGRYLFVLGTGEIGDPMQYGPGGAFGLDGAAGFEIRPAPRHVIRLAGRAQYMQLDFDGTGFLSRNRDNDPSTRDVTGATDTYLGGWISYGYLF